MTNSHAKSLLMLWSEYVLKKDNGAQGYPKQSNYTKLVQVRGSIAFNPDFDTQSQLVDKFMTELMRSDLLAFEVVSMCYCIRWVKEKNGTRKPHYTNLSSQVVVANVFKFSQTKVNNIACKVERELIDFMHDVTMKG